MRKNAIAILCGILGLAAASGAQAQAWLTIDLPGETGQIAQVGGISPHNTIAGFYWRNDGTKPGFVRTSDGTVTTFVPVDGAQTIVTGINAKDQVVGYTFGGGSPAFVRSADGTVVTFNVSATTVAACINDKGQVAGTYQRLFEKSYSHFTARKQISGPGENHRQIAAAFCSLKIIIAGSV